MITHYHWAFSLGSDFAKIAGSSLHSGPLFYPEFPS